MIGNTRKKKQKQKEFIKPKNLASYKVENVSKESLSSMLLDDLNQATENPFAALREEDKVRQGYKNALVQLAANLGHAPNNSALDPLDAAYVPSLRWRHAIDDLHGLLLPADGSAPPEPLLECLTETMLWERHLCPLLIEIEAKYSLRLIQCMAAINGPLADLSDPGEHLHRRRGWKKTLCHEKLQNKLVAILVWALEVPDGNRAECQLLIRTCLTLLRNGLSCPDQPPPHAMQQDRLIRAMQTSQLLELLGLAVASLQDWPFADLFPLLLEITSLIFTWIHPDSIWGEQSVEVSEISEIARPIRHSRFMGTICVQMEDGRQRVFNQARFHELTQDGVDLRRKRTIPHPKVNLLDWPRLVVGSGVKRLMQSCLDTFLPHVALLMGRVEMDEPSLGHIDQFHCSWLRLAAWLLSGPLTPDTVMTLIPVVLVQKELRQLGRWREGKAYVPIMAALLFLKAALPALLRMEQSPEYASMARSMLANLLLCEEGILGQVRNMMLIGERRAGLCFHRLAIEVNGMVLDGLRHLSLHPGNISVRLFGLTEDVDVGEEESAVSRFTEFTRATREDRYQAAGHLYCHLGLLSGLIPALRRWDRNTASLNEHLAGLLEAIYTRKPALLWRVSVLHAVQRVIRGPLAMRNKHPRLHAVAEVIGNSFMEQVSLKPLMLLRAFFPPIHEHSRSTLLYESEPVASGLLSSLPRDQQIRQLVLKLVSEEELSSSVTWLKSHLEAALTATSEYQLIAETTAQRRALSNPSMLQLLRVIGAQPPGKNQKTLRFRSRSQQLDSIFGFRTIAYYSWPSLVCPSRCHLRI